MLAVEFDLLEFRNLGQIHQALRTAQAQLHGSEQCLSARQGLPTTVNECGGLLEATGALVIECVHGLALSLDQELHECYTNYDWTA